MLKGLLAGSITMGVAAVFPEGLVFPVYASVLGIVAGLGPGMAMASQNSNAAPQWVETVVVMAVGLVGLWIDPFLLVLALVFQAFWCLFWPRTVHPDDVPEGLPAFMFSYALVSAAFVAYVGAAVAA